MSCEGSQGAFFAQQGTSQNVAGAFGGSAADAAQALDQIFATARAQAVTRLATPATGTTSRVATLRAQAEDKQAEAATRALFAEMQALGIKPPTHSATGLPKKDAQYGYAAIRQTLQAIATRTALPALAQQVREAQQRERTISAINRITGSLGRCANCGRFAGAGKAHICPQTASGAQLQGALMRRLGVPESAYDQDSLQALIAAAKTGNVTMRHNLTGETVSVTLDGLAVALRGGFVPDSWEGRDGLAQVQLGGSGAIVPVLNATNLNKLDLRGATGVQQAAAAYGQALAVTTVAATATILGDRPVQQVVDTPGTTATLLGGQGYDLDHFIGTEFRKRKDGSYGQPVTVAGQTFTIGERLTDRVHYSRARTHATKFPDYARGEEPMPKTGNLGVGRTLLAGIGILASGEVVEVADAQGKIVQVQVYDADRRTLLAVYDPHTDCAGATDGATNASPAQMAALIAYQALHPSNGFDRALAADLERMYAGGSPVAAADSAYIVIKNNLLSTGNQITFGAQVGTQKCLDCGQFMGAAHNCPTPSQPSVPVVAPPAVPVAAAPATPVAPVPDPTLTVPATPAPGPVPVAPVAPPADPTPVIAAAPVVIAPEVTVQLGPEAMQPIADALRNQAAPNVTVQLGPEAMQPIADALRNQPAPQISVQIDTDALTAALQAGQQPAAPVTVTLDAKPFAQALKDSMTALVNAPQRSDAALAASMDRLAAALSGAAVPTPAVGAGVAAPVASTLADPVPSDDGPTERPPRTGGTRPEGMPITAVEHILKAVRMPAPDPYLSDVPTSVGGQRRVALSEQIPAPDPNFEVNAQTERILRVMSATLQAGAGKANNNWSRAFSVYGPPGTGKNSLARQLAASVKVVAADGTETQGMNYAEVNVTPEMSLEEAIGTTVLAKDPQSGATISQAQMGKIGLAAAMGSVICVNEIVRNPKLATALQSMLEDGEIQINSPEAGLIRIPVHPSTVFVMTWNPGLEGDAERPAAAALSRTIPLHLGAPTETEQARRVDSFFAQFGDASAAANVAASANETRRQEIVAKNYTIDTSALQPAVAETSAAIRFFTEVNALAGGGVGARQVGLNSAAPTGPGPRQLNRFIILGKAVGWGEAKETLRITCDQDDSFGDQWEMVSERFAAHFGDDGLALDRKIQGSGPTTK